MIITLQILIFEYDVFFSSSYEKSACKKKKKIAVMKRALCNHSLRVSSLELRL